MEAFSDGVIAIIITIMVLELKPPHDASLSGLIPLTPVFLSYVLSFVFLGIYWSNHHHLLQVVKQVDGRVLWANLHLLFWLSLTPFVTAWMGEKFADSVLAKALGSDFKGKISIVIYLVAIPLAFVRPWIACALYVCVAVMWLVPDPRIEKRVGP